jgi:two-component system, NtrC family, sensor histidine kinase HydH
MSCFVSAIKGSTFMKNLTAADTKPYSNEHLAAMGLAAAVLAHEIANELNVILCAVQEAEAELTEQREQPGVTSALHDAKGGIERLCSLLQQFRNLARPQKLRLQPTDLAFVVKELLAAEKVRYAAQGIHVKLDFVGNLPRLMLDVEKFRQALLNLCTNAAEAMPEGGTLKVRAHSSKSSVSLEISDTGVGIPAGVDVFALFATTKPQGTGLGLAIVRQIISAHGGTVTYSSQPGTGTVFRLMLPLNGGTVSQATLE